MHGTKLVADDARNIVSDQYNRGSKQEAKSGLRFDYVLKACCVDGAVALIYFV